MSYNAPFSFVLQWKRDVSSQMTLDPLYDDSPRTHLLLHISFVPMMITRIILSLKKAASIPPKFDMIEIPDRFSDV
jgi:hypothetical protein